MKKYIDNMDIESLIEELELKDSKYKKVMRRMQIVFFIFIFFYAGLFLVNPDPDITINERLAGGCYVVAFVLFTLQFRKMYNRYKAVNYFDSVKKVLQDAERRYRLWQKNLLLVGTAILLIDAATILIFYGRFFEKWSFWKLFTIVQLVYILAIGIGFTIGYIKWRTESRPIWLSVKNLLKELEEE
jgi:hypothetical protein